MCRVLKTVAIHEKNFKEIFLKDLEGFHNELKDGEIIILIIPPKLGSFNDPKLEPYVYSRELIQEAIGVITPWVDEIISVHYNLPALNMEYFVAIMPEEEFEELMKNSEVIEDENLKIAVLKMIEIEAKRSNNE